MREWFLLVATIGMLEGVACGGAPANDGATEPRPAAEAQLVTEGASGALTADQIRSVMADNRASLRACYDGALLEAPGLEGRVVTHFVVGADGQVGEAAISESSAGLEAVADCLIGVVRLLSFPTAQAETTVNYPFQLAAEASAGDRQGDTRPNFVDPFYDPNRPREVIEAVIREAAPRIRECYASVVVGAPETAGRVVVKFVIALDGSIMAAEVATNETQSEELGACVVSVVRTLTFPSSDVVSPVTYPFDFQPQE